MAINSAGEFTLGPTKEISLQVPADFNAPASDGKLKGACRQCGFCCRHVQFTIPCTPDAMEWAKARGIQTVQSNEQWMELRIHQLCLNYRSDGKCELHEKGKPQACKDYPKNMVEYWERHGMNPVLSLGDSCGFKYHG